MREEVKFFAEGMEEKLGKTSHKPHWGKEQFSDLIWMLEKEVVELKDAISAVFDTHPRENAIEKAIEECFDVGNFPMMIADNLRKLKRKEKK